MRPAGLVPLLFWAVGIGLLVDAVLRGTAQVALLVIVPVFSGRSVEFLLGVLGLLGGFVTLPLVFAPPEEGERPTVPDAAPPLPAHRPEDGRSTGGGFLLIGPVPILFGSWRHVSARTRWWLAAIGGAILLAFAILILYAVA